MVNALRPIEPGAIFPLKIEFCPDDSKEVRFITFLRFYFAHSFSAYAREQGESIFYKMLRTY